MPTYPSQTAARDARLARLERRIANLQTLRFARSIGAVALIVVDLAAVGLQRTDLEGVNDQ